MDLVVKGQGSVRLDKKRHFILKGGEASVYGYKGVAFKIYHDPKDAIPLGKFDELNVLDQPNIIRPEFLLLDSRNRIVGFTMRLIEERDRHYLSQLFTKAFRNRYHVAPDAPFNLVNKVQKTISFIHSKNIVIVDLNEMNLLVTAKFDDVLFIDVNSYQTPSFPADALAESVRDRHAKPKQFSELTDWFSFAVVAFQMFVGIHPYKGRHAPTSKMPVIEAMDLRMQKNISVFNSEVSIPKSCYPLDVIPEGYKQWFKAVLEDGKRVVPPVDGKYVIAVAAKIDKISGTDNFDISEIDMFEGNVIDFYSLYGARVTVTTEWVYLGSKQVAKTDSRVGIVVTPKMNHVILVKQNGSLDLTDLNTRQKLIFNTAVETFMCYDGRLYVKHDGTISEVEFIELPSSIIVQPKPMANVLEQATQVFDGVVVQSLLGACYVSVFPQASSHYQVKIDEINDHRIINAKFVSGVLMVLGEKKGRYDRFVVRFSSSYTSYDITVVKDVGPVDLNFTVLDNGICVMINEKEEMELFQNRQGSQSKRVIDDPDIHGDMILFKDGQRTMFARGNSLYSLTMKKNKRQ